MNRMFAVHHFSQKGDKKLSKNVYPEAWKVILGYGYDVDDFQVLPIESTSWNVKTMDSKGKYPFDL